MNGKLGALILLFGFCTSLLTPVLTQAQDTIVLHCVRQDTALGTMSYSSPETWHDLDQAGQQDNWLEHTEFYSNQERRATTCVFDWPEGLDPSHVQNMHMHVNYRGTRRNAPHWYWTLRQNTGNWVVVGDNETASNQQGDMVFEIPGSPAAYVQDGEIQLAYRTAGKINASALNYATIELEINETTIFSHHVFIPIVQVQTGGEPPIITPTPTPTPEPSPEPPTWNEVGTWVYQLSDYQNDQLNQIAAANFDLAVIDLARDGSSDFFTQAEIAALQETNKLVLAYFEIGAIENYRPEWPDVPGDLKLGAVSGWAGEQYVKYWDERWWPIVQGRIDQALAAGFDGAYLDMIVTYEEIPADAAGTNRNDLASKMVDLIDRASVYAKSIDPEFKIVPQNAPELYTWPKYLPAIDGLGMEELYYLAMDRPCDKSWCIENRDNAAAIAGAGNLVLSIDYANEEANIADAYTQSLAAGFVPYVSVRNLNVMRLNSGWPPD